MKEERPRVIGAEHSLDYLNFIKQAGALKRFLKTESKKIFALFITVRQLAQNRPTRLTLEARVEVSEGVLEELSEQLVLLGCSFMKVGEECKEQYASLFKSGEGE